MIQGSMVALVTPMLADGALDWDAFTGLIEFHIEQGSDALVIVGTTGESATLNHQEHCEVIERAVKIAAGRLPIIAGTGANATDEAITLTRCAAKAGADACLLVTPYYNKPTQEGLFRHFSAIAAAVAIPQILYNVPGRTACDMLPETVARLALLDNIVGLKEATGDLERAKDILARCGDDFALYSGDDGTAMELMLLGGKGDISVTANIAPNAMHRMCAAAIAGDRETATRINDGLIPLHQGLFVESNPIPVKWALHEMGRIGPGIRLPLTPLADTYRGGLRDALQRADVL